jgi:hypothetical protein
LFIGLIAFRRVAIFESVIFQKNKISRRRVPTTDVVFYYYEKKKLTDYDKRQGDPPFSKSVRHHQKFAICAFIILSISGAKVQAFAGLTK